LADLAAASADIAGSSARLAKIDRISTLLAVAAAEGDARTVTVTVSWLSGELPQRQIGVGWAALRSLPAPAEIPALTVTGVDAELTALAAISGTGSQALRRERLRALFAAATADEQPVLKALLTGELRQGALDAVAADALARAAEAPPADVRRAVML
nr:ATP-dependent DNA ligase [Streptomyces sp. DSM 41633]